jgi:MFS family permease
VLLAVALTLGGGALRIYGLDRGVPYHFHADEMLALRGAQMLRAAPEVAAASAKFFVYPVLPKRLLGIAADAYERYDHPLDLGRKDDAAVLMLLGRAISALASVLTIPVVFLIGRRTAGNAAGAVAAAFTAGAVVAIANAHFFTSDSMLTLFCAAALLGLLGIVRTGDWPAYLIAGASVGLALSTKYTGAFLLLPLALAHGLSPGRPRREDGAGAWFRWGWLGLGAVLLAIAIFFVLNPLVLEHPGRFLSDVRSEIVETNFQSGGPIWTAQFADVARRRFWFTNLLPWSLGPAMAVWALAGLGWLLVRRDRAALVVASYLVFYYLLASRTTTPYVRYVLPAVPGLAVAAGVLSADLLRRSGRWRAAGALATAAMLAVTWFWALAYMRIYRQSDVRLQAARFIEETIPDGAPVLVEPSHNIPPTGRYLENPELFTEYTGWGAGTVRKDEFELVTLDVYRHLYDAPISAAEKRQYIRDRLALVDYIAIDDTFEEFYAHLHEPRHAPVREFYRDLFSGRLGFVLLREFRVNPALLGVEISDEPAEMTFSLFDHPTIYVFQRVDRGRGTGRISSNGTIGPTGVIEPYAAFLDRSFTRAALANR